MEEGTDIVAVAARVGRPRVVLSGGCFQNRLLTERVVAGLRDAGFVPYWHQCLPPNDGGIAAGQAVIGESVRGRREAWRTVRLSCGRCSISI